MGFDLKRITTEMANGLTTATKEATPAFRNAAGALMDTVRSTDEIVATFLENTIGHKTGSEEAPKALPAAKKNGPKNG